MTDNTGCGCFLTSVKNIELFTLLAAGALAGRSCGLLKFANPVLKGV